MSTLHDAIQAIRGGDNEKGRRLLLRVLKSEPENQLAWLWMASVVEGERREYCLERVLSINPENEGAWRELGNLQAAEEGQARVLEPVGPEPQAPQMNQCPYCAKTIRAAAVICRYCGRNLAGTGKHREPERVRSDSAADEAGKTCLGVSLGILSAPVILVVIIVGLILATCAMCYGGAVLGTGLTAISP